MTIPSRTRLVIAVAIVVTAGVLAGLGAADRIGPFRALGAAPPHASARASQAPLSAAALYPSPTRPATVHQIIEIQDPPAPLHPSLRPVEASAQMARPTSPPPPSAAPTSSQSSTPCPDDCQGGGGDN